MIVREIKDSPFKVIGSFDWFNDYKDTRSWARGGDLGDIVNLLDAGYAIWFKEHDRQIMERVNAKTL